MYIGESAQNIRLKDGIQIRHCNVFKCLSAIKERNSQGMKAIKTNNKGYIGSKLIWYDHV